MKKHVALGGVALLLSGSLAAAEEAAQQSSRGIEEVVVTAQRTSESIQDVPIAVTALSASMLEDKQILGASDLQMNAPNVSFTATNFGGSSFSIRGIGRLVISNSGEAGVSTHVDEIPVESNLNAVEYFDVERVEVLRGPQGTLYGRNATGGAINIITAKPDFDGVGGFLDAEYANYDATRFKGMLNVPITDTFAIRAAGMMLNRDGFIDNVAYGQTGSGGQTLRGINSDLDGRDIWAARISAAWDITDRASLWVQYNHFKEDDDRARITNQVCVTNSIPTTGCLPDAFGFEGPHLGTTTGGLFGGFFGALPLGDPGNGAPGSTVNYDFERPEVGFRKMHTDFDPIFEEEEKLVTGGFNYAFDNLEFGLLGAYQRRDYLAQQDYNMDVGPTLNPIPGIPVYPTSAPAGGAGDEWGNGPCNYEDGTSGIFGGCILNVDQTRIFSYDQADATSEYYTVEAKLASSFTGKFNFLVGANYYDSGSSNDYYVISNTLDLLGLATGAYPSTFNSTNAPDRKGSETDGYAFFGEIYYDLTDTLKLTAGLRYNEDTKKTRDTNPFLDANYINGPGSDFSREAAFAQGSDVYDVDRAEYYNADDAFLAAIGTPALSPQRLAAIDLIPILPLPGERRDLTGSPSKLEFSETTGRIGLDWQLSNNSMVYGFFSKGYKPGGFNPPVSEQFQGDIKFDFQKEKVNAFEIGSKNTLADGQLVLNGSLFYYDYKGLQITRIANNSSINDNIDATIWGLELETVWNPEVLPGLMVDAAYSYLNTEVDGGESVDPVNRTAGSNDWVLLENIDLGAVTGVNYVASRDDLSPAVINGAILAGAAIPVPGTIYPDGIPAYLSRTYLDAVGVETSDGQNSSIDGNSLPNSPEHTFHLGVAYTWDIAPIMGALTARWDYYWQDDSYAREFNTRGDSIDSWDQHNASLIYESNDGRWSARAWIRNIEDEDNVTGKYLTADTSGFYRNYFLTEPRVYGASVRYNFGVN